MTRTAVKSTNVRSWGYDEATSELEVEMVGGEIFRYSEVPASVEKSLLSARDVRAAFLNLVKGKYSFKRIEQNGKTDDQAAKQPSEV